jgi:endonuclease/exonuclease/phosphatase family metal-dependent hydrolase
MPTSKYQDDQVDEMYSITEEILEEERKCETNTIKIGDWNSVVGDKSHRNIAGPHGLGRISQRGEMLIDICERNTLVITNIWCKKTKRRLYTWKAPDQSQHQLDYILVKHQFRNSKMDVQAMHRADIYSASDLLAAKVCTRL